jgi:hypothetical protein
MKRKAPKNEYEAMLRKSRLFSKKLLEFAFRELKDAKVRIDESDDPEEFKMTLTSLKKEKNFRILVEYICDDNRYDVEIIDFLDSSLSFLLSTDANSEIQKLIPPAIKKNLRDKYLKTRTEIN